MDALTTFTDAATTSALDQTLAADPPRLIHGDGTPEAVWQAWAGLATTRRLTLTEWLPADARLVVVAPHPDDEVLACGGLLGSHAQRGGACLVVAVTDGEASHADDATVVPATLARQRRAESLQGLQSLDVRREDVARLGLPDGALARHTGALSAGLQLLLRPGDVVVSTWRYDGHPDHEATGHTTATVCAGKGCRFIEAPVWMWHWARPESFHVPWSRLRGFRMNDLARGAKGRALSAHASQLAPRGGGEGGEGPLQPPVLGAGILERARRTTEFFFA